MNETFKKLTAEIKAQLSEAFGKSEAKEFVEKTKAAQDTGSFEVIISTADIDRQGESVNQDGWDLVFYKMNPVVLWAHDYWALPIGICDEIAVQDGKLVAKGRFAPEEANPFAQQVRRLYDLKIVRATSVGFIPKNQEGGNITAAELLEFSFVPVPANPLALSLSKAQAFGLDLAMIATKGLKLEIHVAAEGDACTMDDGTEGEMHPNDAGEMVCMPKKAKAIEGDPCTLEDGTEGELKPDDEGTLVCVPKVAEKPEPEKTKGEISDQVDQAQKRDQKWKNLNKVWDIFDAFVGVYLDDVTPVEDFQKLLDEAIALMKQTAGIEKGLVAKTLETFQDKNRKLLGKKSEQFKKTIAALRLELQGNELEGGGKENPHSEKKVDTAGLDRAKADLELYLATRQILRAVDNAVEEGLRKMKNLAPDRNRKD